MDFLLGSCKEKGCTSALHANVKDVVNVSDFRDAKAPFIPYRVGNWAIWARCPNGHKCFKLHRIEGTFSDKHKCDSRCTNAKGHKCTCSCGGVNHGRGYAVDLSTVQKTAQENNFIGEPGKWISGTAKVEGKRTTKNGATLYTFRTASGSVIKWFAPDFVREDYTQGQDVTFRAKVKAHEDNDFGKATIVTHLQENNGTD